jgi:hypothetical protein
LEYIWEVREMMALSMFEDLNMADMEKGISQVKSRDLKCYTICKDTNVRWYIQ